MERVLGYTRLSKKEQMEGTHTLEQHIARLKKAGATEIYYDIASRSKDDRAGLNSVLELIATKQVKTAVFIRVDRMTDSPTLLERAINICLESNARIIGIDDAIDFHTVGGRTHARILVTLARAEVERLSERCKAGWEYLRSQQIAVNVPFGYFKLFDKPALDYRPMLALLEGQLELCPAAIAREIVDAFLDGKSLRKAIQNCHEKFGVQKFNFSEQRTGFVAARALRWSPSGLKNWLTNPVLRGHLAYLRDTSKPIIVLDTHPEHRLITDEEYREIEAILAHNRSRRGWGMKSLKYPLSGLIVCEMCGGAMYSLICGKRNGKERPYRYYQCKNYQHRACPSQKTIRMDAAEPVVIAALIARAAALTAIAQTPPTYIEPPELSKARSQLQGLENLGQNPAIEAAKVEIEQQIAAMMAKSQRQEVVDESLKQLLLDTFSDPRFWEGLADDRKREIYRALVDKIVVRDGKVEKVSLRV